MAFKELQSLDADNVIALGGSNKKTGKKNPQSVEGYYLGSRKVASKKSKNGFAYIHYFQTSKGNLGVWGKTDLDRKLLSVATGTMVRASFSTMKSTPNGDMYVYKVEQDTENTIEVDLATGGDLGEEMGDSGVAASSGYEDSEDEETEEAEEEAEEEAPVAISARRARQREEVNRLRGAKSK